MTVTCQVFLFIDIRRHIHILLPRYITHETRNDIIPVGIYLDTRTLAHQYLLHRWCQLDKVIFLFPVIKDIRILVYNRRLDRYLPVIDIYRAIRLGELTKPVTAPRHTSVIRLHYLDKELRAESLLHYKVVILFQEHQITR